MSDEIPAITVSTRRFKWSLEVDEPWVIHDFEIMDRQDIRDVMQRCLQQVARASYMVNGPNREVRWWVEYFNDKKHRWMKVCDGKSRVKDAPKGLPPGPVL